MLLVLCAPASAAPYKSIWGPLEVGGVTQFPTYQRLGVGIYQVSLSWSAAAPCAPGPTRLTRPTPPIDGPPR